jgi:hypothetical protein
MFGGSKMGRSCFAASSSARHNSLDGYAAVEIHCWVGHARPLNLHGFGQANIIVNLECKADKCRCFLVMVNSGEKHVRLWPKADMGECTAHVRFWG